MVADSQFISGHFGVSLDAPLPGNSTIIENARNGMGVSYINNKEHTRFYVRWGE